MEIPGVEVRSLLGAPVVVASDVMREVFRLAAQIASTDAAVLITGETGVGKELVARAVHDASLRRGKPWVDVNCAALPDHLVESELFGYDKGAFSGADTAKQGLFELAHTGSIFLDEIGELDPRVQVKLLRVLDGAPYYRLGGTRKVTVDTRVIAATNAELESAVREGRFRGDLFYRLAEFQIRVPPLREREADIMPLTRFFLKRVRPEARLSAEAEAALRAYAWPGNIRELRNAMVQATALANGQTIAPRHLGIAARPAAPQAVRAGTIQSLERELIHSALAQTGGRHQRAAELLGISRRTLYRKLKAYEQDAVGRY